jgi:phytoene dehydrogenase-like protein
VVSGANWHALTAEYSRHIDAQLASRGHGSHGRLTWQQAVSPADYADMLGNRDGAVSGQGFHSFASALSRTDSGPRMGEYRVGSAAHPGPGIALAGMGARTVAALVAAQIASSP